MKVSPEKSVDFLSIKQISCKDIIGELHNYDYHYLHVINLTTLAF